MQYMQIDSVGFSYKRYWDLDIFFSASTDFSSFSATCSINRSINRILFSKICKSLFWKHKILSKHNFGYNITEIKVCILYL